MMPRIEEEGAAVENSTFSSNSSLKRECTLSYSCFRVPATGWLAHRFARAQD